MIVFEVDVEYPEEVHEICSDLTFLPERRKIEKCEKLKLLAC